MILMLSYLIITGTTTLRVGHTLYKNGIHYLLMLFDTDTAHSLNTILLTGYYLLNLGLIIFTGATWPQTNSSADIIGVLAVRTGQILTLLGVIHAGNIIWLALYSAYKKKREHRITNSNS